METGQDQRPWRVAEAHRTLIPRKPEEEGRMHPTLENDQRPLRCTLRIEKPDGLAEEVEWIVPGPVPHTIRDFDGCIIERITATIAPSAAVEVTASDGAGRFRRVAPRSVTRSSNPYGLLVERSDYGGGLCVEECFDDEDRLRRVTVRGPWGWQEFDLHADGGRTIRWETGRYEVTRSWDATGAAAVAPVVRPRITETAWASGP